MDPEGNNYHNFEWCCQQMENGIRGFKFNFSDGMRKPVIIKLVKNRTAIQYIPLQQIETSCLNRIFKGTRTIPLSYFYATQFGWASSTFKRHRSSLKAQSNVTQLEPVNEQNEASPSIDPPIDYQLREEFDKDQAFHGLNQWNCCSLIRRYSSLDFAIPDPKELMILLHVGGRLIEK